MARVWWCRDVLWANVSGGYGLVCVVVGCDLWRSAGCWNLEPDPKSRFPHKRDRREMEAFFIVWFHIKRKKRQMYDHTLKTATCGRRQSKFDALSRQVAAICVWYVHVTVSRTYVLVLDEYVATSKTNNVLAELLSGYSSSSFSRTARLR